MESNWNQAVEADSDIPQISESGSWFWRIMNKGEHVALQVSDKLLKPLTEAKYLNADNVSRYRCIMRIFFENYEKLKYWLYLEEVYEEMLKDPFWSEYKIEQCQQDLTMLDIIYKDAQSTLGVTDSFQGKQDSTATSGTAKQASISQAAGRFSSKRENKKSAYVRIYTAVFQLMLAFADESIEVRGDDGSGGQKTYKFSRYDFLDVDPVTGEYVYDDDYIIDIDSTAAYTNDRQAMWEEIRNNFATGAYGSPQDPATLQVYWESLSEQGYPGAKKIADKFVQVQQAQAAQMQDGELAADGTAWGTADETADGAYDADDAETAALIQQAQGLL